MILAQGYIGLLELKEISIGERIVPKNYSETKGVIGPDHGALQPGKSFWVYALDSCDFCGEDIWVKIFIRDLHYANAEIVNPPNDPEDWGFLE